MKKLFFPLIFLSVLSGLNTKAFSQSIDTLNTYGHSKLPSVNVSNKLYYERHYTQSDTNQPPILQYICLAYNGCRVGSFISFYPSGKVKETGHYKEMKSVLTDKTQNGFPGNVQDSFPCNIQDGDWNEYAEDGTLVRSYFFVDGKIVKENYKDQF